MEISRRASLKKSSTTKSGLLLTKSASSLNPMEVAASLPVVPSQSPLPRSQSTLIRSSTQKNNQEYCELNLQLPSQKKNPRPTIQFPVSPDPDALAMGEGITNSNHPQHRLIQRNIPNPFTCMGCKEYGAGTRFTCQQCNFELHDFCALAPPALKAHPLHSQHQLVFYPKPGKGLLRSKCDVCGKPGKGYMYQCSACSFQLHPCCAMLSSKMNFPKTHPHPLILLPAATLLSSGGDTAGDTLLCGECKRRRSGQVYSCTVCDYYYLHAVCAKNMVNGLQANGIRGLKLEKPSMLGVAAKIASHVVVGFVGGIFEGLGEGLGEALTQNFVKGRCNSTKGWSSDNLSR